MYQLFLTPTWFNGFDLVFEAIALIIVLFIAGYSWKIYKLSKGNKFAYFSLAFIMLGISFLFKIYTSGVLYFFPVREITAQILMPVVGEGLQFADLFYRAAFFFQMILMLGAWLLIFFISQKSRARLTKYYELSQLALFIYLITLISIISNFKYFIFYLTSAVILGMTVLNYYKNYLNTNKNKNAYLVMLAFFFVLFGNLSLVFVSLFQSFYVIGEVLNLIGFLILLYTYRKITKR